MVLSKDAKAMLLKENLSWKMYLVEGEVQTDARKLLDVIAAKKVACTFNAKAAEHGEAEVVKLQVTDVQTISAANKTEDVKTGSDLTVKVTIGEGDEAKSSVETLTCVNLSSSFINVDQIKKALGKHIAAE